MPHEKWIPSQMRVQTVELLNTSAALLAYLHGRGDIRSAPVRIRDEDFINLPMIRVVNVPQRDAVRVMTGWRAELDVSLWVGLYVPPEEDWIRDEAIDPQDVVGLDIIPKIVEGLDGEEVGNVIVDGATLPYSDLDYLNSHPPSFVIESPFAINGTENQPLANVYPLRVTWPKTRISYVTMERV